MIKQNLDFKQQVIRKLLKGRITTKEAAELLGCKRLTVYRYRDKVTKSGLDALKDGRHSNNYKLSSGELSKVLTFKKHGHWRSARKVLEITNIQKVTPRRVRQILVEYGLNKLNVERLKPIVRFVAKYPNDLWQADIQGKMYFPYLGDAYLIANIDDHSRFTQTGEYAQSTYQYYAKELGIELIFAHRSQTKGKIERFWRFVQQDFVRENLKVRTFKELNEKLFA